MDKMHSLLARQLKGHFAEAVPENLQGFIAAINAAYWQFDDDRRMVERSLELSSQELIETNSQLRAIFEALPDLFFHIDHTGKIIDYKTGNLNGFNFSPEILLGKYIQEIAIPEWREQFGAAFRRVREKKSPVTIEYSANLQAGTEFYEARLLPLLEDHVVVIIRNITRRKQAEQALEKSLEKIKTSLHEKEVLLKEIHHRVKNNMQVISSLLSLQAGYIQNPEALRLFKESENRIRSMALVHEKLYKTEDLTKVDFAEYIPSLTNHLMSSYASASTAVALRLNIEHITLGLDAAIPCGLIINELVSNALKHAFAKRPRGDITIDFYRKDNPALRDVDDVMILSVKDNGVGLPEKFDFRQSASLGLKLVLSLAKQLKGRMTHHNRNGAEFRIEFKPAEKNRRKLHA